MAIPESKFKDWKGTGADKGSAKARGIILNSLRGERSPLKQKKDGFDVRLQGSYANTTHTRGSSDVDVIAKLTSSWGKDLSQLSEDEKVRYRNDYVPASYTYRDFYGDVYRALKIKFNASAITKGNKSLKIDSDRVSSLPVDVDVVPCSEYRVYRSYPKYGDPQVDVGMYFRSQADDKKIVNFPQYHRDNGEAKNQLAGGNYKETIRIFKNARDYTNDSTTLMLTSGDVPSYYIECLLYNVPNRLYRTSGRSDRFTSILDHLDAHRECFGGFDQQSEMAQLFGLDETQWSTTEATRFLDGMRELWEVWPH